MDYDYSSSYYSTPSYTTAASSPLDPLVWVMAIIMLILSLAVMAVVLASLWRMFTKAGKPGWAALIPIYNTVVLMQIIGRPEWWVLLLFVPFVNLYVAVVSTLELAKSFGKSTGFGVLMLFFPVIMYPMLGFGSSQYLGPVAPQPAPYYPPQQPQQPPQA
jgi:hypothetical protein